MKIFVLMMQQIVNKMSAVFEVYDVTWRHKKNIPCFVFVIKLWNMFLGSDAYYRLRDKERNVSVEKSRNILDNHISKAINKKC